jgi:hypothetical protein
VAMAISVTDGPGPTADCPSLHSHKSHSGKVKFGISIKAIFLQLESPKAFNIPARKCATCKKIYNIGYIPNMYKLFDLKNNNWNKYYIKSTSISNTLTTILSICQLYNIHFAINIELKNYLYKTIKVSFEDI